MRRLSITAILLGLSALPAAAQTSVFRSVAVQSGKSTRVATITALKGDCTIGTLSDVKVVSAPKNGALAVRSAKLKTPASYRCPNIETPVHGLFYQPNTNFSGSDEISYEIKGQDGNMQRFNLKLEIGGKAPAAAPAKKDLQEL